MASIVEIGTRSFTTASGTHTSGAFTPVMGDLPVVICGNTGYTGTVIPTDDNGDGGTYSLITSSVKASSADTLQIYIRNRPFAKSVSTTITHAPGTTSGGGLACFALRGFARKGSAAVRASAIQSNIASGTPTPVLGGAALTTNPLLGVVFTATNGTSVAPRSSPAYTEVFDVGYNTPATGVEAMTINSGETASSIAWGGAAASAFCDIIVEFDASYVVDNEPPLVRLNTRDKPVVPKDEHNLSRTAAAAAALIVALTPLPLDQTASILSVPSYLTVTTEVSSPARKAGNLITVLTSYGAAYDAGPDLVLRARRSGYTEPLAEQLAPRKPGVLSPVFYPYVPQVDIVLRDRRSKDVWTTEYGPGRVAPLIVGLTTYGAYVPGHDTFLRDRRSKETFPLGEQIQPQRPGILAPTFYPYVPALDIAKLDDRRDKSVDPAFSFAPARTAPIVSALTSYAGYVPGPDTFLRDRRSKETFPLAEHLQPRAAGITSPVFYRYAAALDVEQLDDRRDKSVDPPFAFAPARSVALVSALTSYAGYNPAPDLVLRKKRAEFIPSLSDWAPSQATDLIVSLTDYPISTVYFVAEPDTSGPEPFNQPRKGSLIVALTSYAAYNPAPDIVFKRPKTDVFVEAPFIQPREANLIALGPYYQDLLFVGQEADRFDPIQTLERGRSAALIVALTTYAPYVPAPDLVLRAPRLPVVIVAPPFLQSQTADLVTVLTAYAAYVPGPDIVLRDRRAKDVYPLAHDLSARKAGVLSPVFSPYVASVDIRLLDDLRSKYVDPAFEFSKAQTAQLVSALTSYAPYDFARDTFLRDRRSKDAYPLLEHLAQQRANLIGTLTAYVVYNPALDVVLRDRRSRHVDPAFEYLKWQRPDRRITDAIYVPARDIVLPDHRSKHFDPAFIYLKERRSAIPTALFDPTAVPVNTTISRVVYFAKTIDVAIEFGMTLEEAIRFASILSRDKEF